MCLDQSSVTWVHYDLCISVLLRGGGREFCNFHPPSVLSVLVTKYCPLVCVPLGIVHLAHKIHLCQQSHAESQYLSHSNSSNSCLSRKRSNISGLRRLSTYNFEGIRVQGDGFLLLMTSILSLQCNYCTPYGTRSLRYHL
jgi:hypothetical protein